MPVVKDKKAVAKGKAAVTKEPPEPKATVVKEID